MGINTNESGYMELSLPARWNKIPGLTIDAGNLKELLAPKLSELEKNRETRRQATRTDLEALQAQLNPTREKIQAIESSSDEIGGVHGLKQILGAMNLYPNKWGKINADTSTKEWQSGLTGPWADIFKWLLQFQKGMNSPYSLDKKGKLLPLDKDGNPTQEDEKTSMIIRWYGVNGIPESEFGTLGPITISKLKAEAEKRGIILPPGKWDVWFKSASEFLGQYGGMIDYLTNALNLPKNLILGIIKQESWLGTNPNDYTWWNGVMQLTTAPLADMSGETSTKGRFDTRKALIFQKLFQRVNPEMLQRIPSMQWVLETTLDSWAWDVVFDLCDKSSSLEEYMEAIKKVRLWERWKFKGLTFHTLNILVGSVYLAYIKEYRTGGRNDVTAIARNYNGSAHRDSYALSVANHVWWFNRSPLINSPRKPLFTVDTPTPSQQVAQADDPEDTTDVA